jgi:hypothetical protein
MDIICLSPARSSRSITTDRRRTRSTNLSSGTGASASCATRYFSGGSFSFAHPSLPTGAEERTWQMEADYRSWLSQQSSCLVLVQIRDSGFFSTMLRQGDFMTYVDLKDFIIIWASSSRLLVLPVHRAHAWPSASLPSVHQVNAVYCLFPSPERTSSASILGRFITSLVNISPHSTEDALFFVDLLHKLSLHPNLKKCQLLSVQQLDHLGMFIDTVTLFQGSREEDSFSQGSLQTSSIARLIPSSVGQQVGTVLPLRLVIWKARTLCQSL